MTPDFRGHKTFLSHHAISFTQALCAQEEAHMLPLTSEERVEAQLQFSIHPSKCAICIFTALINVKSISQA